jgi:hypothetical protein
LNQLQLKLQKSQARRYASELTNASITLMNKLMELSSVVRDKPRKWGPTWISLEWMCKQLEENHTPESVLHELDNLRRLGMITYYLIHGCYWVRIIAGDDSFKIAEKALDELYEKELKIQNK